jgi:hypothetical protein
LRCGSRARASFKRHPGSVDGWRLSFLAGSPRLRVGCDQVPLVLSLRQAPSGHVVFQTRF